MFAKKCWWVILVALFLAASAATANTMVPAAHSGTTVEGQQ